MPAYRATCTAYSYKQPDVAFLKFVFFGGFYGQTIHTTAKVSEEVNRNMPARNTLVQLLTLYTDPERQNAQRHTQADRRHQDANSRSYCVAVRSAKNPDVFYSRLFPGLRGRCYF